MIEKMKSLKDKFRAQALEEKKALEQGKKERAKRVRTGRKIKKTKK